MKKLARILAEEGLIKKTARDMNFMDEFNALAHNYVQEVAPRCTRHRAPQSTFSASSELALRPRPPRPPALRERHG
jgi:hypothetical protein